MTTPGTGFPASEVAARLAQRAVDEQFKHADDDQRQDCVRDVERNATLAPGGKEAEAEARRELDQRGHGCAEEGAERVHPGIRDDERWRRHRAVCTKTRRWRLPSTAPGSRAKAYDTKGPGESA